jgi:hypothetical protein
MLNARGLFAAAALSLLALACTAPAVDYEGMAPLDGSGIALAKMSYAGLAPMYGEFGGKCRARLLIGPSDGKVLRATFIGGSKRVWRILRETAMTCEFRVSPSPPPGPWELDVQFAFGESGGGRYGLDIALVSYRTARQ